jgi:hypothetical protein
MKELAVAAVVLYLVARTWPTGSARTADPAARASMITSAPTFFPAEPVFDGAFVAPEGARQVFDGAARRVIGHFSGITVPQIPVAHEASMKLLKNSRLIVSGCLVFLYASSA